MSTKVRINNAPNLKYKHLSINVSFYFQKKSEQNIFKQNRKKNDGNFYMTDILKMTIQ